MIGWRGHLGKISPAPVAGRVMREFYDVVPDGVDLTIGPLTVQTISRESMADMMKLVGNATELLAEKGVDAIYLGGIPPIVMQHPGYDLEVVAEMEKRSGVPAPPMSPASWMHSAQLGIKRLVMAAPFEDWVIDLIKKYYGAAGFDIVHMKGMPLKTSTQRRALPIEVEYTFTRQVFRECKEQVDGIYIPCGGWGTVYNVERLEQDLGKPVVTWFTAHDLVVPEQAWVRAPIRGFGSLLESLSTR